MSRTDYAPETKAAVMAALLEGQSVSSAAKEYEIPKGTVSRWKKLAFGGVRAEGTQKGVDEETKDVGALLMTLLTKNIESLIAMSEVAADKNWLKKMDGASFATLFGVKHDKAVRMIEAMNASDGDAP